MPAIGAVHNCCLVKTMIYAADGGIIKDTVIADHLPGIYQHKDKRPVFWLAVPADWFQAKRRKKRMIQKSTAVAKECKDKAADHHH